MLLQELSRCLYPTVARKRRYGPAARGNRSLFTHCRCRRKGAVKISWKIPGSANYEYIRVTYTHPGTGKEHIRLASVYADHIVIDGLLKRYGAIELKLMPVTAKGREGEVRTYNIRVACAAQEDQSDFRL